jgi:hypothetical protein
MDNEFIAAVQRDHIAVTREDGHEIASAINALRSTGCRVKKFKYRMIGDHIEKLFPSTRPARPCCITLKNGFRALKAPSRYLVIIGAPAASGSPFELNVGGLDPTDARSEPR